MVLIIARFFFRIVVIAADISPIDVLSHLPILCEDKNVPYIYVKSRAEVGEACKTKRPTSCVLITPGKKDSKVMASYERCMDLVKAKNQYVD
jgi:H/ACA ribonucleoprotein complex subunit 2